ncbi:hypothetical protein [Pseudoalteromonas obscura]|uniref:Uncharacterized protein n=1 Tax=Pseudoalteromonas obscura TaxID=3048491 RepID=A0ABT7EPC5_9GAMM|nr:hypothetical protein [Pseudoalteromonas sp. P94(2023)]MDK2596904.1 hypothetical protein [Pseudoalteromonas sp. P94(2023)]
MMSTEMHVFDLAWTNQLNHTLSRCNATAHNTHWAEARRRFRVDLTQAIIHLVNQFDAYMPTFIDWLARDQLDEQHIESVLVMFARLQQKVESLVGHNQIITRHLESLLDDTPEQAQEYAHLVTGLRALQNMEMYWRHWIKIFEEQMYHLPQVGNRFELSGFVKQLKIALDQLVQLREQCEQFQGNQIR